MGLFICLFKDVNQKIEATKLKWCQNEPKNDKPNTLSKEFCHEIKKYISLCFFQLLTIAVKPSFLKGTWNGFIHSGYFSQIWDPYLRVILEIQWKQFEWSIHFLKSQRTGMIWPLARSCRMKNPRKSQWLWQIGYPVHNNKYLYLALALNNDRGKRVVDVRYLFCSFRAR